MRFSTAGTIAACIAAASAFQDTSPFLLFSTQDFRNPFHPEINDLLSLAAIEPPSPVLHAVRSALDCRNFDDIIVVSQPGVNAADYANPKTVPHLRKALKTSVDGETMSVWLNVPEVAGKLDVEDIQRGVEEKCSVSFQDVVLRGADVPRVEFAEEGRAAVRVHMPALSTEVEKRRRELEFNDSLLQAVLSQFKGRDYLVVYATTPREDIESNATPHGGAAYEPEFQEPLKMEIKRATGYIRGDNSTKIDRRPLFEKYQFFTPGLFMGLLVTLLLLAILSVGIKAISSLEVSYAAFEKEMGPAAHRKAQ